MKYLEFYSGIGGHRFAINDLVARSHQTTCCKCLDNQLVCLGAFDVSTSANDTYMANFPTDKPSQKPIETLTPTALDAYGADLWLMSPPCQPYTRQRSNQPASTKDVHDKRSNSLTHLTNTVPLLSHPPRYILLENVVGFESSESCRLWLNMLTQCNYEVHQFHLSPVQFGVPNVRPRYFCIASKRPEETGERTANGTKGVSSGSTVAAAPTTSTTTTAVATAAATTHIPLHTSLDHFQTPPHCHCWPNNTFAAPPLSGAQPLSHYLDHQGLMHAALSSYLLPLSTLTRSFSNCIDLVSPSSCISCCFTKSYGTYLNGTGSVVVMEKESGDALPLLGGSTNTIEEMEKQDKKEPDEERPTKRTKTTDAPVDRKEGPEEPPPSVEKEWHVKFGNDRLRYFTPAEISRLLGFPKTQVFPSSVSLKKRYALLGNSLHVGTVTRLLHVLLSDQ